MAALNKIRQREYCAAHVTTPLLFTRSAFPRVWGGSQLEELFGERLLSPQLYGEIWEIADLSQHDGQVIDGAHEGKSLSDLWKNYRSDFAPQFNSTSDRFPLLIKWLDCHDWISVQTHPNDQMAREFLEEPWGKSEVWIVLRAEPTARIYAGFRPDTAREDFLRQLEIGAVEQCLHSFKPQAGDCVVLPAGTVHAAGGGVLMAEVQQSSDSTFRIFDWNRLGLDGKPRSLQIDLALRAIDWNQGPISPVKPQSIGLDQAGILGELLTDRDPFRIERYTLSEAWKVPCQGELVIWMVLSGRARLTDATTGEERELVCGRSVLVPAAAGELLWSPSDTGLAILLCVRLSCDCGDGAQL